jgi:hypothetical protein
MHPVLASRICTPTGNCCQQKLQGIYVVPARVADCRRHGNSALLLKNSLRCTRVEFRSERPRQLPLRAGLPVEKGLQKGCFRNALEPFDGYQCFSKIPIIMQNCAASGFPAHVSIGCESQNQITRPFAPCSEGFGCWPASIPFDQRSLRQRRPAQKVGVMF